MRSEGQVRMIRVATWLPIRIEITHLVYRTGLSHKLQTHLILSV